MILFFAPSTKRLALKRLDFIICEVFPFNSHSRTNTWLQVSLEEANSNFSRQVAHCQLGYRHKILPALHTKDQCTLWSSIISISETYPHKLYSISRKMIFSTFRKRVLAIWFQINHIPKEKNPSKASNHRIQHIKRRMFSRATRSPRGKTVKFPNGRGTRCNFRW